MAVSDIEQDAPVPTLGDVLYAKGQLHLTPESDWVALVHAIAAGNPGALHALYARANRPVFTLMIRLTANRETAEELTVDVFHDVWRRAARYDAAGGTVLGWIMNQARSRAIDRLRFDQRQKRMPPAGMEHQEVAVAANPEDVLALERRASTVRVALDALSADQRSAIEQAFFFGRTYAEVAERLNQPLGTIKTRVRAGLHKLRQALEVHGK